MKLPQRSFIKNVHKTSVIPERDFGMLDRLIIEKPRLTFLFWKVLLCLIIIKLVLRGINCPLKKSQIMLVVRQCKDTQKAAYVETNRNPKEMDGDDEKIRADDEKIRADDEEKKRRKLEQANCC